MLNDLDDLYHLFFCLPEAAVRSQKQAESEDCDQVDIEHFEKILPQLVRGAIIIIICTQIINPM